MLSTALLLNVLMIGLVAAVVLPAFDFAIRAQRAGGFTITTPYPIRLSRSRAATTSAGYASVTTPNAALMSEYRGDPKPARPILHVHSARRPARTPVVRFRGGRGAISAAQIRGTRRAASYATPDVLYVTSNGLTLTPHARSAASLVRERRVSHPHSEYWRYGNPEFYAYA